MKLTKKTLDSIVETMEWRVPKGYEEAAMAAFGPNTAWERANDVVCTGGKRCSECDDPDCMPFAPPLFDALAELYFRMNGAEIKLSPLESSYYDGLPF